jgi:hypothetical protein
VDLRRYDFESLKMPASAAGFRPRERDRMLGSLQVRGAHHQGVAVDMGREVHPARDPIVTDTLLLELRLSGSACTGGCAQRRAMRSTSPGFQRRRSEVGAGCGALGLHHHHDQLPCHGSKYSITDGSVVNPPAPRPLPPKTIKVKGDTLTAT